MLHNDHVKSYQENFSKNLILPVITYISILRGKIMKYPTFKNSFRILMILLGVLLWVQCDNGTDRQNENELLEDDPTVQNETDNRYDGTDPRRNQTDVLSDEREPFEEQKENLIRDMETLSDNLDNELEEHSGQTAENSGNTEEIKSDQSELERALERVRNSTEETWQNVREEVEDVYDRLTTRHEDRRDSDSTVQ